MVPERENQAEPTRISGIDKQRTPSPQEDQLPPEGLFPTFSELLAAALYFVGVTIVLRWRALPLLSSHYIGGTHGDPGLYIWLSKTSFLALDLSQWFTTNAFYPYGASLAWSDNFLLPSLCIRVFEGIGLTHPAAYNLVLLLAQVLNGVCAFLLTRFLISRFTVCLLAATAFCSFSFITEHSGHPQLQFSFWIPLNLIIFLSCLKSLIRWRAVVLGVSIGLTFLSSVYYALFSISLILIVYLSFLLTTPKKRFAGDVLKCALPAACGLALFLPFILPYLSVQEAFGRRGLYQAFYFSTDILSYISAGEHNVLYGFTHVFSHNEAHLFGGLTILILLSVSAWFYLRTFKTSAVLAVVFTLVAQMLAIRHLPAQALMKGLSAVSAWLAIFFALKILSNIRHTLRGQKLFLKERVEPILWASLIFLLALSLGPLGNDAKGDLLFSPYVVWHYLVPGFGGIRAVGRLGIMSFILMSILAACAFGRVVSSKGRLFEVLLTIVVLFFILTENWNRVFPLDSLTPSPAVLQSLEDLPPGVVLNLPFTRSLAEDGSVTHWSNFAELNVLYMNWYTSSGREIVNGYTGLRSNFMKNYPRWMSSFPSEESIRAARRIVGLRYIVVIPSFIDNFDGARFHAGLKEFSSQLKIVSEDALGNLVIELLPKGEFDPVEDFVLFIPPYGSSSLTIFGKDLSRDQIELHLGSDPQPTRISAQEEAGGLKFTIPPPELQVSPHKLKLMIPAESKSSVSGIEYSSEGTTVSIFRRREDTQSALPDHQ